MKTLMKIMAIVILSSALIPTVYSSLDDDANLEFWLRGENNMSDMSPNSRHFSVDAGSIAYVDSCQVGACFDFDGGHISYDGFAIDSSDVTFVAHINTTDGAGTNNMYAHSLGNGNAQVWFRHEPGSTRHRGTFYDGSGGVFPATSDDYNNGSWFFVVYIREGTNNTIKVYNDACSVLETTEQIDSSTRDVTDANDEHEVGGDSGTNYFDGLMDEVRLYSRVLHNGELFELCNYTISEGGAANVAPNVSAVTITPSSPDTSDNLECNITVSDDINTTLTVEYVWYNNSVQYNGTNVTDFTVGTNVNIANMGSSITAKDENWNCSVRAYDGEDYSSWNSDNVTIGNSLPSAPTTIYHNENTGNQSYIFGTVNLNATGSTDSDSDSLTYYIEVNTSSDYVTDFEFEPEGTILDNSNTNGWGSIGMVNDTHWVVTSLNNSDPNYPVIYAISDDPLNESSWEWSYIYEPNGISYPYVWSMNRLYNGTSYALYVNTSSTPWWENTYVLIYNESNQGYYMWGEYHPDGTDNPVMNPGRITKQFDRNKSKHYTTATTTPDGSATPWTVLQYIEFSALGVWDKVVNITEASFTYTEPDIIEFYYNDTSNESYFYVLTRDSAGSSQYQFYSYDTGDTWSSPDTVPTPLRGYSVIINISDNDYIQCGRDAGIVEIECAFAWNVTENMTFEWRNYTVIEDFGDQQDGGGYVDFQWYNTSHLYVFYYTNNGVASDDKDVMYRLLDVTRSSTGGWEALGSHSDNEVYQWNTTIEDIGSYQFRAYANDGTGSSGYYTSLDTVTITDVSSLGVVWTNPTTHANHTQNENVVYQVTVTCNNPSEGYCNINASIDPKENEGTLTILDVVVNPINDKKTYYGDYELIDKEDGNFSIGFSDQVVQFNDVDIVVDNYTTKRNKMKFSINFTNRPKDKNGYYWADIILKYPFFQKNGLRFKISNKSLNFEFEWIFFDCKEVYYSKYNITQNECNYKPKYYVSRIDDYKLRVYSIPIFYDPELSDWDDGVNNSLLYNFEENDVNDDLLDSWGNPNNHNASPTVVNTTHYTTGASGSGYALNLSGANAYYSVANSNDFKPMSEFEISFAINGALVEDSVERSVYYGSSNNFFARTRSGRIKLFANYDTTDCNIDWWEYSSFLNNNQWHYVTIRANTTHCAILDNGTIQRSEVVSGVWNFAGNLDLVIGRTSNSLEAQLDCFTIHLNNTLDDTAWQEGYDDCFSSGVANNAPVLSDQEPTNNTNYASGTTSVILVANWTDADNDTMTISFVNSTDSSIICTNTSISSGTNVSCEWTGLINGSDYQWYTNSSDGTDTTISGVYNFSVNATPTVETKSGLIQACHNTPFCTDDSNPVNYTISDGDSIVINWTVNATGDIGTTHEFFVNITLYDDATISNQTTTINITIDGGASPAGDSCTYSSGDWTIDCSDNCLINDSQDLGGNDLIITGTGKTVIRNNITNIGDDKILGTDGSNRCYVNIYNATRFII